MSKAHSIVYGPSTRQYYKYQNNAYVRPNLTSNSGNPDLQVWYSSNGNIWGQAYQAFDGDTGSCIHSYQDGGGLSEASLYMHVSTPLNVTGIYGNLVATESANPGGEYTIYLYGSNDNSTYTLIYTSDYGSKTSFNLSFSNSFYYSYYRIRMYCGGGYDHDEAGAREIYLTATYRTIVPGTSSDYDFFRDSHTAYSILHGPQTRQYYKYANATSASTANFTTGVYSSSSVLGTSLNTGSISGALEECYGVSSGGSYTYLFAQPFTTPFTVNVSTASDRSSCSNSVSVLYDDDTTQAVTSCSSGWQSSSSNSGTINNGRVIKGIVGSLGFTPHNDYYTGVNWATSCSGILYRSRVIPGTSSDYDFFRDSHSSFTTLVQ